MLNIGSFIGALWRFVRGGRVAFMLLFVVCMVAVLLSSCDRGGSDAPRRDDDKHEEDVNGGKDDGGDDGVEGDDSGSERPGLGSFDEARELADDGVRYRGPELSLRFDRGGVLVKVLADGSREFVDLDDSRRRLTVNTGEMSADSLFPSARITVGGQAIGIKMMKMRKQTADVVWFHVVDSDGHDHVIVMP